MNEFWSVSQMFIIRLQNKVHEVYRPPIFIDLLPVLLYYFYILFVVFNNIKYSLFILSFSNFVKLNQQFK